MKQLKSICLAAVFVFLSAMSGRAFADDGGGGDGGSGDGGDGDGGESDSGTGGGDCGSPEGLSDAVSSADNAIASVNDLAAIATAVTGQPMSLATLTAQTGAL